MRSPRRASLSVVTLLCLVAASSLTRADDVSDLLARYSKDPGDATLCEQIGLAYTRANDFDNAAAFFRRTLRLNPRRTSAERNLATVLWFAGHRAESKSLFASLQKRFPDDPVPQLYLGLSAYDNNEMQNAARHFERAGPLASDNPEV